MSRLMKFKRQVSVFVLAVVCLSALLLATGIITYSDNGLRGGDIETVENHGIALADPNGIGSEETIPGQETPLANPDAESSFAILSACLLVVFTVVLVWFLVFRPQPEEKKEPQETVVLERRTK